VPAVTSPVVVVGATGVLRPAAELLVARGTPVLGVARTATGLAALGEVLGALFEPHPFDGVVPLELAVRPSGAIVYGPAVGDATIGALRQATDGPTVLVLTSAAAAPGPERWTVADLPPSPGVRRLVLGWTEDGAWHDAAAISAAAVDLLDAPVDQDRVLGVVRPWSGRPS
jgi:hypothetical protein